MPSVSRPWGQAPGAPDSTALPTQEASHTSELLSSLEECSNFPPQKGSVREDWGIQNESVTQVNEIPEVSS